MKRPNDSGAHAREVGKQHPRNTQRWTGGSPSGGRIASFAGRIVPHPAAFFMTLIGLHLCHGLQFLKTSARHLPAFRADISAAD